MPIFTVKYQLLWELFLLLSVFASIVETLHFLNWCPIFDDFRRSEASYKDFFSKSDDWIMIIVSVENILALMLPTYVASKFKNLVSILHAGKMYCAKTSSFRFSRRSKWKTVHAFAFLLIHARAIGKSENPGGEVVLYLA